jgi:hypothetical protein
MNKKKILAELVGYLVRKEFTVYEVLDAYYEESERHFFEDDLPEVTIPSEESAETLETLETEPETIETASETKVTEPDFVIPPEMTLKEYRQTQGYFSYALAKHYTVNGKTIEQYLNENNIR